MVTLKPDPVWIDRYEKERERIKDTTENGLLGVFHVGSTAIPDLAGKPALDILVIFEDYESMSESANTLRSHEYEITHDDSEIIVLSSKGDKFKSYIKMHMKNDIKARNQLLFRNYLRENSGARDEYERVKRKAIRDHSGDLEKYTKAKTETVSSLLEEAREKGHSDHLPEFV